MAGIKIFDLPALGRDLASTDLFELSLAGGTGSRKITGQEILNSARLGLVSNTLSISTTAPLSGGGNLSANRTLSISQANTTTDGYLSSTDWNTFNGKQSALVSGTNIKTINGTSVLGSGDLTISTGITIGTTAITSGTVGRVLFEGTGNVVSESANLFWDNTNGRLGIGTSSPTAPINIVGGTETFTGYQRSLWLKTSTNAKSSVELVLENTFTTTGRMYELASYSDGTFNITDRTNSGLRLKIDSNYFQFHSSSSSNSNLLGTLASINALWFNQTSSTATTSNYTLCNASGLTLLNAPTGGSIYFRVGNSDRLLLTNGGNFLIGTTTDAGYKLDVNGTARITSHADGLSFSATGNANTRTSGAGTFIDFQSTYGRLFAYNFGTSTWLPILLGSSRLIMSGSIGTRTENFVGSSASFSGDVKMLSQQNYFGSGENNGIFSPATYSNTNYPAIDSNSIGLMGGISSLSNAVFLIGTKINFQVGTGVNSKIAEFTTTTGNFIIQNGGTFTDISSALIQMNSTTKGFLPPRMTTTQKNAIASPTAGLQVFDTTLNQMSYYNGSSWVNI